MGRGICACHTFRVVRVQLDKILLRGSNRHRREVSPNLLWEERYNYP